MKFTRLVFLLTVGLGIFSLSLSPAKAEIISSHSPYIQVESEKSISPSNEINSDAYLIGDQIYISQPVNGDIIAIAEKVTIAAPVKGSLKIIASQIEIKSQIQGSLSFLAQHVYISPLGEIEGDVYGLTKKLYHEGRIQKDLNLSFSPEAEIKIDGKILGNFYYTESRPDLSEKANIAGTSQKIDLPQSQSRSDKAGIVLLKLLHSASLILIGLIILKFFPQKLASIYAKFTSNLSKNILKGILVLVVTPLIIFILTLTLVGIPLALFICGVFIWIIYTSPILTGIYIGKKLFPRDQIKLMHIILGVLIFDLITLIPVLGGLIFITSVVIFSGSIFSKQ